MCHWYVYLKNVDGFLRISTICISLNSSKKFPFIDNCTLSNTVFHQLNSSEFILTDQNFINLRNRILSIQCYLQLRFTVSKINTIFMNIIALYIFFSLFGVIHSVNLLWICPLYTIVSTQPTHWPDCRSSHPPIPRMCWTLVNRSSSCHSAGCGSGRVTNSEIMCRVFVSMIIHYVLS